MLFTINLVVANLLEHLRSCQFTGQLVRSPLAERLYLNLHEKTIPQTDWYFFTEIFATKAKSDYVYGLKIMYIKPRAETECYRQ